MKRRAERQKETRRRITEAAVELHQTVGASRTTVSAIAEKAGVQRHTYYAHFPELKGLYQACVAHYLERNPLPAPSSWAEVSNPKERLRVAISEVYAYYGCNEPMLANAFRDAQLDPLVAKNMELLQEYWEGMRDVVADGWNVDGERHEALLGAIALALDFHTWRTLVRQQGLSDEQAIALMVSMVQCLVHD